MERIAVCIMWVSINCPSGCLDRLVTCRYNLSRYLDNMFGCLDSLSRYLDGSFGRVHRLSACLNCQSCFAFKTVCLSTFFQRCLNCLPVFLYHPALHHCHHPNPTSAPSFHHLISNKWCLSMTAYWVRHWLNQLFLVFTYWTDAFV